MDMKYGRWYQVDGDISPETYGGTIAKLADADHIELLKIQPVREYVGEREAPEVGFPFWTKEAWFDNQDLALCRKDVLAALECCGQMGEHGDFDTEPLTRAQIRVLVACCLLDYGCGDEGPAGWARDILPSERVQWCGSKRPRGWRYLESEDIEFRTMLRERG